jgi:hypothetical protein
MPYFGFVCGLELAQLICETLSSLQGVGMVALLWRYSSCFLLVLCFSVVASLRPFFGTDNTPSYIK